MTFADIYSNVITDCGEVAKASRPTEGDLYECSLGVRACHFPTCMALSLRSNHLPRPFLQSDPNTTYLLVVVTVIALPTYGTASPPFP